MSTVSFRPIKAKDGSIHHQIIVNGGNDPLTGKRLRAHKTVCCSQREMNAIAHQMMADMDRGIAMQQREKITVAEWMDEWIENYLPNIEETTRIGYKTKLRCYIKPSLGHILIKSLKADHVQKMINNMIAQNLSPKNIRDTYNNINAAMKQAVKLRKIPYNPCEGVVLPKLKRYRASIYDANMINQLLTTAKDTDIYIPVLLGVMVGLRRGEILALRWDNIDFENGVIEIKASMARGEKGAYIKAPKSEAGIRDLHVGDEVMQALRQARIDYLTDKIAQGVLFKDDGFVVRQSNGKPMTPDAMTRKWKRFIQAHNLPNIRFHDLRHSNATALIMAGVNPKVVQQRLGHADVSITLNTYTHVLPEMDADAADKLDQMFLKKA